MRHSTVLTTIQTVISTSSLTADYFVHQNVEFNPYKFSYTVEFGNISFMVQYNYSCPEKFSECRVSNFKIIKGDVKIPENLLYFTYDVKTFKEILQWAKKQYLKARKPSEAHKDLLD